MLSAEGEECVTWRDGWKAGKVEGACEAATALLEHQDPVTAAKAVLESLDERFGPRARVVGAYKDLVKRIADAEAALHGATKP